MHRLLGMFYRAYFEVVLSKSVSRVENPVLHVD